MDNFFINARLFTGLKLMNIKACDTIKIRSEFSIELVIIRAAATKQKDWDKQDLITIKSNKIIDDENVLCMIWVDLNIVQFMITMHTINEMKTMIYNDARRRKNVLESVISDEKLSFSISIVEYNRFMSESNENAQQRSYYSSHRLDRRYWWSFFVFLLNAVVLNAYKLWDRLYLESKLSHSEFQQQIVETLLQNEITTRKRSSALMINVPVLDAVNKSDSCEWKFTHKRSYC